MLVAKETAASPATMILLITFVTHEDCHTVIGSLHHELPEYELLHHAVDVRGQGGVIYNKAEQSARHPLLPGHLQRGSTQKRLLSDAER